MILFLLLACANPASEKPKAELLSPSTPIQPVASEAAPLQAPTGTGKILPVSGTLAFVGAKLTRSHEGVFSDWKGELQLEGETLTGLRFSVRTATVKTDSPKLDTHLISEDFFNATAFPEATFVSSSIQPGAPADAGLPGATHMVEGEMTLHNVKKQLRFPAVLELSATQVHARTEFAINRKDFGIVYPGRPDDLIREEVLLKVDVSAVR